MDHPSHVKFLYKTDNTELTEAINSMLRWYRNAARCYAYLSGVPTAASTSIETEFENSTWFKRGWTLQELLAPISVHFHDENGAYLGDNANSPRVQKASDLDALGYDHVSLLPNYLSLHCTEWNDYRLKSATALLTSLSLVTRRWSEEYDELLGTTFDCKL